MELPRLGDGDSNMSRALLRFQVDSRIATLLSQEYPSSERALKELVDNAWDADAERRSGYPSYFQERMNDLLQ